MARPLKIAWKHTEEKLYDLYRQEKDADLVRRWQALWLLRRGERLIRVKAVVGVVVWDNAAFHRSKAVGEVGLKRIYQPPYSPGMNRVEGVFEEVRQYVEGGVYGSIEAKKRAVEEVLRRLESEGRLSTLVGWS